MGWIGVDLDSSLATYGVWSGEIGEPIPVMVRRVKSWLLEGKDVRIFTARVGSSETLPLTAEQISEQRELIEAWCIRHIGQPLLITATKDYEMEVIWDDRAITVEANTGRCLTKGIEDV